MSIPRRHAHRWVWLLLVSAITLVAAGLNARGRAQGATPQTAAITFTQQPVFRSTVDVIAVDVQVVDRDGNPIGEIGADAFQVSINGQKRNVVSAQFVRPAQVSAALLAADATKAIGRPTTWEGGGRTFVLAVDSGSFEVGTERASMEGARTFVQHLDPADRVGLFVYPTGAKIAPTTERAPIRVNLDRVVGQKDPLRTHYNLRPWEIVDITAQKSNPNSFLTASREQTAGLDLGTLQELDPVLKIQNRECPLQIDCPSRIYAEGMGLATQLERQVEASLNGLESLPLALADIPGGPDGGARECDGLHRAHRHGVEPLRVLRAERHRHVGTVARAGDVWQLAQ